jgi:hypothetical protein
MSEIEFEKKYRERYVRWSDKTREQLSFFNNLLLTFSIGFLSFVLTQEKYSVNIRVSTQAQNGLLLISILLILLSVLVGLLLVINRLYDFRITSHINQVRYWFEKSQKNTPKIRLDKETPENYCCSKRLILTFKVLLEKYPRIKIEDCDEYHTLSEKEKREFKEKFRKLRNVAHNLSLGTWNKLKWQIFLFFIGLLLFAITLILK